MEIRVLEKGLGGHFRTPSVLAAQVLFNGDRLHHVVCDFPTEDDEREFLQSQRDNPVSTDSVELMQNLGGAGRATLIEESGARIEIYGSVRALAPALRQIADAFEERLAQLPS